MRISVYILYFIFMFAPLVACSSSEKIENLTIYRQSALRHLVSLRIGKQIESARFKDRSIFSMDGWSLMFFQRDNVDRSTAIFFVNQQTEQIECGLYIREVNQEELVINLIECTGVYANELSGGEYGLRNVSVTKSSLKNENSR